VNVAADAPANLVNSATVSGGTETNTADNTANDPTVITFVDLTMTKSHTGNFLAGQVGARYTLAVVNLGQAPSAGTITITEIPPAGVTVTGMSGVNWSCTVATLTCTRSAVLGAGAAADPITVMVNVAADALTSVTNRATVSGGGDTNAANSSAEATVNLGSPDLLITKTYSGGNVAPGAQIQYSVVVSNIGNGKAMASPVVVEQPPPGLTITNMVGQLGILISTWSCSTSSCTWRGTPPSAGQVLETIIVSAQMTGSTPGPLTNTVSVSAEEAEANPANNAATATINVVNPDLQIALRPVGQLRPTGSGAGWDVTVTNVGNTSATAFNLALQASGLNALTVPAGCSNTFPIACAINTALAPGATWTGTLLVSPSSAATAPSSFTLRATLTGGSDTSAANNTAESTQPLLRADYAVTVAATGALTEGVPAVFNVTVSNVGNFAPPSDTLTLDLVVISANSGSGAGWTCSTLSRCTRPCITLPPGASATVTVTLTPPTLARSIGTSGTVSSGSASEESTAALANNTTKLVSPVAASAVVLATPLPSSNGSSAAFYVNRPGTVLVSVVNTGSLTTSGYTSVTLSSLTGASITALSGSGWLCTVATLTCLTSQVMGRLGYLPTLSATVVPNAAGEMRIRAVSSGGGGVNAAAPDGVYQVLLESDLQINKTHTGYLSTNGILNFTISVTNVGAAATSQPVTVVDAPPAGMTITSMSGTGWTCTLATLTCTRTDVLAAGASYPNINVSAAFTLPGTAPGTSAVTNRATVSMPLELNTANNTSDNVALVVIANFTLRLTIGSPRFDRARLRWLLTMGFTNAGGADQTSSAIALQAMTPATARLLNQTGATVTYLPGLPCLELGPITAGATVTRDLEFDALATFRPHILGSATPR